MNSFPRPTVVTIVASSHRATVTHSYADDARTTECGRTITETWTGEYDEGLGWGLPTCKRCYARVEAAHAALVESARYGIGQTVGILVGQMSVDGPHIDRYATVVNVQELWTGVTEYIVREYNGSESTFREYLLTDDTARHESWINGVRQREASKLAHPAGKGRAVQSAGGFVVMPVKIGGTYPQNVLTDSRACTWSPETRQSHSEMMDRITDLLSPNPWNV